MRFTIQEIMGKTRKRATGEVVQYVRGHRANILNKHGEQVWKTSVCATAAIAETVARNWIRDHSPAVSAAA